MVVVHAAATATAHDKKSGKPNERNSNCSHSRNKFRRCPPQVKPKVQPERNQIAVNLVREPVVCPLASVRILDCCCHPRRRHGLQLPLHLLATPRQIRDPPPRTETMQQQPYFPAVVQRIECDE